MYFDSTAEVSQDSAPSLVLFLLHTILFISKPEDDGMPTYRLYVEKFPPNTSELIGEHVLIKLKHKFCKCKFCSGVERARRKSM